MTRETWPNQKNWWWCHVSITMTQSFFSIYDQFGAIWKLDSRGMVFKTYISINNILLSYKNWKQNLKISNTTLILLLWRKILFLPKSADFLHKKKKKKAEISKIKEVLVLKGTFSETTYKCVLTYQNSANSNKF